MTLLAGIAAEGVLFGYQAFAAKAFCAWCLAVFGIVVLVKSKGRGKIPKVACDRVRLEVSLLPETDGQTGNA